MGIAAFEASLADGGHRRLARLAGEWSGSTRVWFEPDGPPTEPEPQHGSMRVVLGGRYVVHEYTCGNADGETQGIALLGLHLDEGAYEGAWIDSMHTGSNIMYSTSPVDQSPAMAFSALGSYGDGAGGTRWGWRTVIEQPDDDTLRITMFNVTPEGSESRAVKTLYARQA